MSCNDFETSSWDIEVAPRCLTVCTPSVLRQFKLVLTQTDCGRPELSKREHVAPS
jgi:hypothetical protein